MSFCASLDVMHFIYCLHEGSDAAHISTILISHYFFTSVVHGIEFSYFISEAYSFKEELYFLPWSGQLEIVLCDAHLSKGRWEQ